MTMDCWHRWLDFKYGEGNGPPPLFPLKRKINVGERAQIWRRSRLLSMLVRSISPEVDQLLENDIGRSMSPEVEWADTAGDPADTASGSSSSSDSSCLIIE